MKRRLAFSSHSVASVAFCCLLVSERIICYTTNSMNILYVALGSAMGGMCRYGVSMALNTASGFPWGTLCVNVVGSLVLGALSGWLAHGSDSAAALRAFAIIGFCGGFTTFSTFSNETFRLIENGRVGSALLYAAISVLSGLVAVWVGYCLSR